MSQTNGHDHDEHSGDGHGHEHGDHEHGHGHGHGIPDAIPESSLQDKALLFITALAGVLLVAVIIDWSQNGSGAIASEEAQQEHSAPHQE